MLLGQISIYNQQVMYHLSRPVFLGLEILPEFLLHKRKAGYKLSGISHSLVNAF